MKIGLLGFGTVGSGVYEIIAHSQKTMLENFEISKILIRNKNKFTMDIMTLNPDDILNDDSIGIVVEAMGGVTPAYEYIMKALQSGKHVVSANKEVVAKHLKEFTDTAVSNNVAFLYEASVCGGIPMLKSIKQVNRVDDISKIYGIFNGTSNYILHNMFENKYEFDDILKIAQDNGYAESDTSADIDGVDIQRKLAIASSLAYGCIVTEDDIPTFGIRNVNKFDIECLKKENLTLKLVAQSIRYEDGYCACVEPVLFISKSIEANVGDNFNIGSVVGDTIGELKFYGQGAGKFPTGNAIVQDIIDIYTKEYANWVPSFNKKIVINQKIMKSTYYVRFSTDVVLEILQDVIGTEFSTSSQKAIITKELYFDEAQNLFKLIAKEEPRFFYARMN